MSDNLYIVVAFNHVYISTQIKLREFEDAKDREGYMQFVKDNYHAIFGGNSNFGYFKSQQEAIDYIKEFGYSIHEGAYYTHLLIEEHGYGWDNLVWGDDYASEMWFEGKSTGDEWQDYEYNQIERPECLRGIVGFA